MMTKVLAVTVAVLLVAVGSAREGDAKKDAQRLQGTWTFVAHAIDGREVPADQLKEMTIIFEGDKFTVKRGGEVIQAGTHTLDASKTPKTVDAKITEGENKGTTMLGIYELKGETMRFAFDPKGEKRPTELTVKEGSGLTTGTIKKKGE